MSQWWSWTLTIVGVSGLYLAGSGRRLGWLVGLGAQLLWVAYAIATRQWGFLLSAFAYGAVNVRNLRRWSCERAMPTPLAPYEANPAHIHTDTDYGVVARGTVSYVRGTAGVPVRGPEEL